MALARAIAAPRRSVRYPRLAVELTMPRYVLRVEAFEPKVVSWSCEAGLLDLFAFLVRRETPPFTPGWTPMALLLTYPSCWVHQLVLSPPIRYGISTYSSAVLVGQVERIPRELDAAAGCALDGQGAVVACITVNSLLGIPGLRRRTGDLPDERGGYDCRHFGGWIGCME